LTYQRRRLRAPAHDAEAPRALCIASVKPVRGGEIRPGAKPADPVTVGALVVTLVPALLQAAVSLVEAWASQRRVRSVKVTIGGDSIELIEPGTERLVDVFLDRHATS
jgi:hypothetical protein